MVKIICDKCGKECDHNAFDVFVNFLHDYIPTHCKETVKANIGDENTHIRFILCQDCYKKFGLPNPYSKEIKWQKGAEQ